MRRSASRLTFAFMRILSRVVVKWAAGVKNTRFQSARGGRTHTGSRSSGDPSTILPGRKNWMKNDPGGLVGNGSTEPFQRVAQYYFSDIIKKGGFVEPRFASQC